MRRALSFIFIFLMLSVSFTVMAENAIAENDTISYTLKVYDSQGRLLNSSYQSIQQCARLKVYKLSLFGLKKTLIADIKGEYFNEAGFRVSPDISKVYIEFYWMGHIVYSDIIDLLSAQKDDLGNYIIAINLPFTPSVPISGLQVEPIKVSADIHQIQSNYYNIKFGVGDHQNKIEISMGGNTYLIPVNLDFSKGGNSETKPFRFLAQSSKGYVQGEEKWLIWTTAYYWSAVRTKLVGDNMLLVVWTYGYTDIKTAWVSTVVSAILAGAVVGATTGIGSISMAGVAGLGSAILWAVHPELMKFAGTTGIGVVAGIFTPRYFIIQGVSGMGTNETSATVQMNNLPETSQATVGNIEYQIFSQSNEIQVGFTRNYGDLHIEFYDFEDGTAQGWLNITPTEEFGIGQYSGKSEYSENPFHELGHFKKNERIKIGISMQFKANANGQIYLQYAYIPDGGKWIFDTAMRKYIQDTTMSWQFISGDWDITIPEDCTLYIGIYWGGSQASNKYMDNVKIYYEKTSEYRYIFETTASDSVIVRHMFGTIPTIAPSNTGVAINNRYTLLAVDMAGRDGMLAVDWNSRMVTISPARIIVKTDVWTETAWLLATDDKDGFKDVTFVVTSPNKFIYRVDFMSYYYFTTPKNWTVKPGWNPFIANNTTIYVPNIEGINFELEKIKWNLETWWEEIGTLGHLALMGLAAFIIFIIILIIAPWLIFALIKILALIIRGLVKALGMAAKGAGNLMKSFKRRRKR